MWILGGEFFFWSKAVDPRRSRGSTVLLQKKKSPPISTWSTPLKVTSHIFFNLPNLVLSNLLKTTKIQFISSEHIISKAQFFIYKKKHFVLRLSISSSSTRWRVWRVWWFIANIFWHISCWKRNIMNSTIFSIWASEVPFFSPKNDHFQWFGVQKNGTLDA